MNDASRQAKAVFCEAIERHPPERWAEFLDQACADDKDLRRQVERLLNAHRELGSFHEALPETQGFAVETKAILESPGMQIGPYRLVEQLGEGGMGVVYLAEQTAPVRRQVALKVIKPGLDTRQVVSRFEAERQALAMMDHPNIAKVLDAGATPAGRPFFVMELVRGLPITEFCDAERMTIPDRLRLFLQVCEAIQHAHQKAIIHRDLKPTNVLVSHQDTDPVVKVIDFGVAKALGHQLTDHSEQTGVTQLVGTPLYMSPEQAGPNRMDVDTRSDVYSLGVLLYELLAGSPPLAKSTSLTDAPVDWRRLVLEVFPLTPSSRIVNLSPDARSAILAARDTTARAAIRLLHGDLDCVVAKALEKDRTLRYATASDLAADIERFLEGQPVIACPQSTTYRLRKFAARHKARLLVAGIACALLAIAFAGMTWQAIRATRAVRLAEERYHAKLRSEAELKRQVERANSEADAGRSLLTYIVSDVLGAIGHTADTDGTVKIGPLLDHASRRLHLQFEKRPLEEARLRASIGRLYISLNDVAAAELQLTRAVQLCRSHDGPRSTTLLSPLSTLADLYELTDRLSQAELIRKQILDIYLLHKPDARELIDLEKGRITSLQTSLGKPLVADTNIGPAIPQDSLRAITEGDPRQLSVETASRHIERIRIEYLKNGRYGDFEHLQQSTYDRWRLLLGDDHPLVQARLYSLIATSLLGRRWAQLEPLCIKELEIKRRTLGYDHDNTYHSTSRLISVYQHRGRYEQAAELAINLIQSEQKKHSSTLENDLYGTNITILTSTLAQIYRRLGRVTDAEELLTELLESHRHVHGLANIHHSHLSCMRELGELYYESGRIRQYYEINSELAAMEARQAAKDVSTRRRALARFHLQRQHYSAAADLLEQAIASNPSSKHGNTDQALSDQYHLAVAYLYLGKYSAAESLLNKIVTERHKTHDDWDPNTLASNSTLAEVYKRQGRLDDAEQIFAHILEVRRRCWGTNHPFTAMAQCDMAELHSLKNDHELAERLLEDSYEILSRTMGEEAYDTLVCANELAELECHQRRYLESIAKYDGVLRHCQHTLGQEHPFTLSTKEKLARVLLAQGQSKGLERSEQLARDCCESRAEQHPNDWKRYSALGLLGSSLVAQSLLNPVAPPVETSDQLSEAENALLLAFEGLNTRKDTIPFQQRQDCILRVVQDLVRLYSHTSRATDANKWRDLEVGIAP